MLEIVHDHTRGQMETGAIITYTANLPKLVIVQSIYIAVSNFRSVRKLSYMAPTLAGPAH